MTSAQIEEAIVRVGGGRGFIVNGSRRAPFILTAAHCLPHLPRPHPFMYEHERTYPNLVGPLGEPATIWVACAFVDPIRDVAVLEVPDFQQLPDEASACLEFLESRRPLRVGRVPAMAKPAYPEPPTHPTFPVSLFTLDGTWETVTATRYGLLFFECSATAKACGVSGGPVIASDGSAVALRSLGDKEPILTDALPGWLLTRLRPRRVAGT